MAKYHVNKRGEAGKCGAQAGGCPFGSFEDHHDSLDAARSAYEKSMELEMFYKHDREINPDNRDITREGFVPQDWDGFDYDEVFENDESIEKIAIENRGKSRREANKMWNDSMSFLREAMVRWHNIGRMKRGAVGERHVPIRLIPSGTIVEQNGIEYTIANPGIGKDGEVRGSIYDKDRNQIFLGPNEAVNISENNSPEQMSKRIDFMWEEANERAAALDMRRNEAMTLKLEKLKNKTLTNDNYMPEEFDGYSFKDMDFDYKKRVESLQKELNHNIENEPDIEEHFHNDAFERALDDVDYDRNKWIAAGKIQPAQSGEANVPMRLIPRGSKISSTFGNEKTRCIVGKTKLDSKGQVVTEIKILDGDLAGSTVLISPDETRDVDETSGRKLPIAYRASNDEAARLYSHREKFKEHQNRAKGFARREATLAKIRANILNSK